MDLDTSGGKRGRRFFRRRGIVEEGGEETLPPGAVPVDADSGGTANDAGGLGVSGTQGCSVEEIAPTTEDEAAAGTVEDDVATAEDSVAPEVVPAVEAEDSEVIPDEPAAGTVEDDVATAEAETGEARRPKSTKKSRTRPEAAAAKVAGRRPSAHQGSRAGGTSGGGDPSAVTAGTAEDGEGTRSAAEIELLGALPPLVLPRVFAVANQKGGVGKTTTAVNLGAALADLGFRVLVVDLDPQGNATTGLGINHRNVEGSIYDVIMNDASVDDCVEPTSLRNLFVVPATIDLAGAEIELVPAFSRELKLKRALDEVRDGYDFVLIDCPPSLGLLTVNGLAAADDVIVPIQCEYYALEGLGQLLRNVDLVSRNLNPGLSVRGIVLTMFDARTKLASQVEGEVRAHFGERVYRTVVPRTVRISEAPSFGQPITVFDPSSRGSIAYRELAKEVSRGASRRAG